MNCTNYSIILLLLSIYQQLFMWPTVSSTIEHTLSSDWLYGMDQSFWGHTASQKLSVQRFWVALLSCRSASRPGGSVLALTIAPPLEWTFWLSVNHHTRIPANTRKRLRQMFKIICTFTSDPCQIGLALQSRLRPEQGIYLMMNLN